MLTLPLIAATCAIVLAARLLGGPELELVGGIIVVALLALAAGLWPALLGAGLSGLAELGMFAPADLGPGDPRELLRLPLELIAVALATSAGRIAVERLGVAGAGRRGMR